MARSREPAARRWRAGFLILASVTSLTWAFAHLLNPDMSQLHAFISEYSARDQPWRWLFQTTDVTMGVGLCLAGVATLAWTGRRPKGPQGWSAVAFICTGVASVVDALVTMDCSPNRSAACRAAEAAGRVSVSHAVHIGTSTVVALGIATPILVLSPVMTRLRRPALGVAALWVISTLLNGAGALNLLVGTPLDWTGLWQRISLSASTLWWLLLAADDLHVARALQTSEGEPEGLASRGGRT